MGNLITYTRTGILGVSEIKEHVVELGQRYDVEREGSCEDMAIIRSVAHDCPLNVCLLLRTNGDLVVWYVEFMLNTNPYWHFFHGSEEHALTRDITDAQLQTMIRLRDNNDIYGNLGGYLGADVIKWAFGRDAKVIASAYHD
ncbi:hypothetical protein EBB07_29190 [Paenibacillaceae bacterium]|nr:hypothetical protein EBB07_29190 [Paenibacillaceae bacterium]